MSPIDRRTFVAAGIGGAVGASIARVTRGEAAPMTNSPASRVARGASYRKAVKYEMIAAGDTPLEKFELVRDLGFDGVEIGSPNGLDRDAVREASRASGVPIHGCVCSAHWAKPLSAADPAVRAECVRAIEVAIDDCRFYGGTTVLVVPAVVNKGVSYREAWDRSRAEIAKVVPTAEAAGVAIAFENVWNNFLLSPLEAAAYVDSFESDAVGWYMDIGNIVAYGWPEHWVETLGPRILKVDVKEYSRKKLNDEGRWAGFGVPIGEGDCDWPTVMRALDDVGFHGWLTAEVGGGGRDRLADIATRMDRIIASAPARED